MITERQQGAYVPELYEVIQLIDKAKSKEEVVEIVKKYGEKYSWFTDYLRCLFDDKIQFLLPAGRPPYTPSHEATYPLTWKKEHLKLGYWVKGLKGEDVNAIKRETMFINTLECIHPEDALLIADMVDKKSPDRLTKEVVEAALPNLL